LLSNAAKYTDPGGQIRLDVHQDTGCVMLVVRDTGVGIEPGMLHRIFEMFVQADGPRNRSQAGLGIGLSLVKTLVEMHGGSIEARSDGPGTGSEFVLRLPVPSAASLSRVDQDRGEPMQASAAPPRRRVLVVDDNVDAADSLARLLSRVYRQDVQVAHDGPEALELAGTFRPEVILLDIGMPGMDGYEVVRRIKARGDLNAARLVALTGWGQEADRLLSREAGFDHHLVKPIDPEDLCRLLASADL
jgi:CheY-like chemotaxis protein